MIRNKKLAVLGAGLLTLSIILGALGAHSVSKILDINQMRSFSTATEYLTIHGLSFLIFSIMRAHIESAVRLVKYGLIIFSSSIYALTFMSSANIDVPDFIGLITPLGGLLMIAGWVWITIAIYNSREHKSSSRG